MPTLEAYTFVKLFKDGEFLDPRDPRNRAFYGGDQVTQTHSLQIFSRAVADHFAWLHNALNFKDHVLEFKNAIDEIIASGGIATIKNIALAANAARGAYGDLSRFVNFTNEGAGGTWIFDVTYPSSAFDSLEIHFEGWSEDDEINDPAPIANPIANPHSFGIKRNSAFIFSGTADEVSPPVRHYSGPDWDNKTEIKYTVNFAELEAQWGEGIYGLIPFTFAFGMGSSDPPFGVGDLGIQHILYLRIKRPPPPEIHLISPLTAQPGETVRINGEHLLGVKEVIIGTGGRAAVTANSESFIDATVPPGLENINVNEATISVRTYGGQSSTGPPHLGLRRKIRDLRCNRQELSAGDIIELEGVNLEGVTDVMFVGAAHVPPVPIPGFIPRERYKTTWREQIERNNDTGLIVRERIFVGVPDGMQELVDVKVTTRGDSKTIGPLVFHPIPIIASVAQKLDVASPATGGSREIVIRGRNLQYSPSVLFANTVSRVLAFKDDEITFVAPQGVTAGHIVVHTSHGTAITPREFELSLSEPLR